MGLETGTYISDFNVANPAHSDGISQADSHMRWIKSAILATFPNITGAVSATQAQISQVVAAVISGTAAILASAGSLAAPGYTFQADPDTGIYQPANGQLAIATEGAAAIAVGTTQAVSLASNLSVAGNSSVTGTQTVTGAYIGGTGQLIPIGLPLLWLDDTLPAGNFIWLNGQAVSRTGNPLLWARWGTKYGTGDGTTTFNVPNFQEVVPVGKKGMGTGGTDPGYISASGVNANIGTSGAIVGEAAHALTSAENGPHTHTATTTSTDSGHAHPTPGYNTGGPVSGGAYLTSGSIDEPSLTTGVGTANITSTTIVASSGSGTAHNNVQPSMVCNYICLAG